MKTKDISRNTLDRYTERYEKMGKHIRTLGWGSEQQQVYRFEQSLMPLNVKDKHLLDIGCGFGDLLSFCEQNDRQLSEYSGWDINPNFINEANESQWRLENNFEVVDLLHDQISEDKRFDIAIMLGLLNFKLSSKEENYEYSKKMIRKAFNLVDEVLVVDFLSAELFEGYPKEDFVFYHEPLKVLEFAFSLSPKVLIKHDYEPIPQREFILYIYK